MSLRRILLGVCAAAAMGGLASAATADGWYVGIEGGASWLDDWSSVASITGSPDTIADAEFKTGWGAIGTVGYAFPGHWRTELELGYRQNDLGTSLPAGLLWDAGSVTDATAMVNFLYDLRLGDKLGLSVGVGAGVDRTELTDDRAGGSYSDEDWNFAYQGLAGLNYAVGLQTTAFLNYRYMRVGNPDFDMRDQYTGATPALYPYALSGDEFGRHGVTAGLRFALNAPEPVTPEITPPSIPPAVEPGPSRQFIVFFGFNKYNLTSAALRVIADAAVAAKESGSATVVITGHTDTVGSPAANVQLSMRRANAVKAEMVRQGVSVAAITTTGKGETELLVQTNDNVKEPQNRRATIDIN